jgi:hypothetical protein
MDYQKIYNNIIQKALNEHRIKNNTVYYEAHHIIPSCLGGSGRSQQWKTHPNIVLLTAREHFISHWLLYRIHPDNHKIIYAFWMMCKVKNKNQQQRFIPSSRQYQEAKQIFSKIHSKKQPEGTGYKKSMSLKGKPKPIGFGDYIGNFHKGRKRSDETKYKMSIAKHGKPSNAIKTIEQYDLQGNFIQEWDSLIQSSKILHINPRNIGNCLNKISKTAGGYIWKFKFINPKICQPSQSI